MADATPVKFQPETPAMAKARAAKVVAEEALLNPIAAPAVDPEAPVHGARFTPKRGKSGVYHALGGDAQGLIAGLVIH